MYSKTLSWNPPTAHCLLKKILRHPAGSKAGEREIERELALVNIHTEISPHWCATHSHECQTVPLLSLHLHDFCKQLKLYSSSLPSPPPPCSPPFSFPSVGLCLSALSKCCIITLGIILIPFASPTSFQIWASPFRFLCFTGYSDWRGRWVQREGWRGLFLLQNDDETIQRLVVWREGNWQIWGWGDYTQWPKWLLSSAARCEGRTDLRRRGEQTNELHISCRERKGKKRGRGGGAGGARWWQR